MFADDAGCDTAIDPGPGAIADVDFAELDYQQLLELQWRDERRFARRIRRSVPGSAEQAAAVREGYDTIVRYLARQAELKGTGFSLGLDRRFSSLVMRLLERCHHADGTPARLFEIGFGQGLLLAQAARSGYDVGGIEVSTVVRQLALAHVPPEFHDALLVGNFLEQRLEHLMGACDVVYWNDVIEHLHPEEVSPFLRRMHALLRPGGWLVTITPNWHMRPSDVSQYFLPPGSEAMGFHLKEYTLREMTGLLHEVGFRAVATPLLLTGRRAYLCGHGLAWLKRALEPALEYVPFRLAQICCRRLGYNCTLAQKAARG